VIAHQQQLARARRINAANNSGNDGGVALGISNKKHLCVGTLFARHISLLFLRYENVWYSVVI